MKLRLVFFILVALIGSASADVIVKQSTWAVEIAETVDVTSKRFLVDDEWYYYDRNTTVREYGSNNLLGADSISQNSWVMFDRGLQSTNGRYVVGLLYIVPFNQVLEARETARNLK